MSSLTETCFLIGRGSAVLWADRSMDPSALPDARERWMAIWANRDDLEVIAHSHPNGPLAFSRTDTTTMAAIDAGLGGSQRYAVVTPDGMVWGLAGETAVEDDEPWWADLLRIVSGMALARPEGA